MECDVSPPGVSCDAGLTCTPEICEAMTPDSRENKNENAKSETSPSANDGTTNDKEINDANSIQHEAQVLREQLRATIAENEELKEHQKSVALSAIKKVRRHEKMIETQTDEIAITTDEFLQDLQDITEVMEDMYKDNQQPEQRQLRQQTESPHTIILSDSMANGIKNRRDLDDNTVLKKFPGQTAIEVGWYTRSQVYHNSPKQVVIIAGTNDVSYSHQNNNFDSKKIVETLIKTGRNVMKNGASVIISGLFYRRNKVLNKCNKEVNKLLKERCEAEGMMYMHQNNIKNEHICDDNLHLNDDGSLVLLNNIYDKIYEQQQEEHLRNNAVTSDTTQNEEQHATQIKHKLNLIVKNIENISLQPSDSVPPPMNFAPLQFVNNGNHTPPTLETIPLRPGPYLYSESVRGPRKATIVATSIARDFNVQELNHKFKRGTVLSPRRFHGGKANDLKEYVKIHMKKDQSDTLVVLGGGNDLPGKESINDIANDLIEAGTNGKNLGATKVCISSVLPRADFHHQLKRHELNKVLKDLCTINGFQFIDNSNIRLDTHILPDGVHLNISGTKLLQSNILMHLNA